MTSRNQRKWRISDSMLEFILAEIARGPGTTLELIVRSGKSRNTIREATKELGYQRRIRTVQVLSDRPHYCIPEHESDLLMRREIRLLQVAARAKLRKQEKKRRTREEIEDKADIPIIQRRAEAYAPLPFKLRAPPSVFHLAQHL